MSSYEQRIRAVEFYIKYGKPIRLTICLSGIKRAELDFSFSPLAMPSLAGDDQFP